MNGQNKYRSSKPRFIFEEHNQFIKQKPIDEELHTYPIIKSVKSEQNVETQNKNNDSQFPIEANADGIQAKVLQTYAPATAKITNYTIATNDNDGSFLPPELIKNEFPIETTAVKVKVENFEPINENTIKHENELITIDDNLRCNYCDFKSKDLPKLLKHTNKCSHKISIPIETVNKVRDVKKGYIAHNHSEHQTKEKSHLIQHINKRRMLSMSERKKTRQRKLKHTCFHCDAKFTSKRKLDAHINEAIMRMMMECKNESSRYIWPLHKFNSKKKLPLACNLCSCQCFSPSGLSNHAWRKHGKKKIDFICDTCGLSFLKESQIIDHLRPGICQLGQTTEFTANNANNFDLDMYQAKTTEKKYSVLEQAKGFMCTKCSFKCTKPISLKEHNLKVHCMNVYKQQPKKTARKYSCEFCKFKSLSEYSLDEHLMKDHKDEKPFFCKLCDCKYSLINDLVDHIKSHLSSRQ